MRKLYGDHSGAMGPSVLPARAGLGFVCCGKQVDKREMTLLCVCARSSWPTDRTSSTFSLLEEK